MYRYKDLNFKHEFVPTRSNQTCDVFVPTSTMLAPSLLITVGTTKCSTDGSPGCNL
jgi:hypothetical protein